MNLITDSGDERLTSDMILNGLVPGDLVTESLRAALAARDTLAAQLCRARTILDTGGAFHEWVQGIRAALSSTGPCFHATAAENLMLSAKDILANGYDQGRRITLRAAIAALERK